MTEQEKYFYVVSFTARNQAGVAIIVASNESIAFSVLQRGGLYNGTPDDYKLIRACNVGQYCGKFYGLALESYTNALVAYDALVSVAGKIVGPIGPVGPEGPTGPEGPMCELRVGAVTELPIGSQPTVEIVNREQYYEINFGIPKYDISPQSLTNLKNEMKQYINNKFEELINNLNIWKKGVDDDLDDIHDTVDGFESDVTGWIEENERVLANALVRHESRLNS